MDNEQVLYRRHPAMVRKRPVLSLLVLAAMIAGPIINLSWGWIATAAGALIFGIWYIAVMGTTLIVTDQRCTLRRGILSRHTNEVRHSTVRNIQIRQSLTQRLFNVGDLSIASAGSGRVEIEVKGIASPNFVKRLIDQNRSAV